MSKNSWESVPPKKHVSQRRRTADREAEEESLKNTIFEIPKHGNAFGPLAEEELKTADNSGRETFKATAAEKQDSTEGTDDSNAEGLEGLADFDGWDELSIAASSGKDGVEGFEGLADFASWDEPSFAATEDKRGAEEVQDTAFEHPVTTGTKTRSEKR